MMQESQERAAARDAVGRAISAYVQIIARENEVAEHPVVVGWVSYAEYTSTELEQEDASASAVMVPDGQNASTSRGLMHFGAEAFSRAVR